jgi:DNA-binding CsgD family transcriptional regulator/tetratricopeptide (TPR) repeat protein
MTRLGPLLSPILVGRDYLLDQADRRVSAAAEGRGQFLLLAGEAGIGKSRLIASIERKARAAGFHAAAGNLAPQDRDVPAASLLDLARTMARIPRFAELGKTLLALADVTASTTQPRRRGLVLQAVDLITASLDGPVMLWFDDLQWADDLSLEILTELARATRERPLLMVGAYRTDEAAPGSMLRQWRSRLLSQRMAEEARLAPLTLEQTGLMTSVILATGLPTPRDVVAAVYERTDGVPLHIEELLGVLDEAERTDSGAIRNAVVPETLEDAILLRLGRLSPAAQAAARAGAVIGRCFVPDVLAGIMDVPPDSLADPLRELVEHDVLSPLGARGLYDFRHQLLRDTLYRTVPATDVRRFHARAAEFGRGLEGASEVHASLHYERAGMGTEAFRSALSGARAAARLSSHREAFDLYRRALDNMPADLPLVEQAALLEASAAEAAATEEIRACERAATEARERYLRAGDHLAAAGQCIYLVGMARREGRSLDLRFEAVEAAIAEVDRLPPGSDVRRVRGRLAMELVRTAIDAFQLDRARAALAAGDADAREAGDEATVLDARSLAGVIEAIVGHVPEGLEQIGATAAKARALGFEDTGVTAYRDAAVTAARVMDYRRAAAWLDEGLRYADAIEQSHCAHIMTATAGLVAWADGRWDDAVTRSEHALADRGCARGAGMARWPLAYTALGRGDLGEARRHLAAATSFATESDAPDLILAALWGSAEAAMLGNEYQAAIDQSDVALELASRTGDLGRFAPIAVTGTRARLAAGRPADAARWLGQVTALLEPVEWFASPALDHARGLVALANGSVGVARSSLERAIHGWGSRGRMWEGLWARLDLAGCLVRSARFVEAAALVADVRETAQRLGSRPLADRADALSRLVRGHGTQGEPWHPLTARELEVARLIATGRTNAEIAVELGIAPKTASAHVEHILAKLGATRRAEIATWVATISQGSREGSVARVTSSGAVRPTSQRQHLPVG